MPWTRRGVARPQRERDAERAEARAGDHADQQHDAARRRRRPGCARRRPGRATRNHSDLDAARSRASARQPAERRSPRAGSARRPAGRRSRSRCPARARCRPRRRRASATASSPPASWKSRKPWTCGKPGRSVVRCSAAGVDGQEQRREDDERREELRPAQRRCAARGRAQRDATRASSRSRGRARPPGAGVLVRALEVPAGLLDEHVVERRLDELERLDQQARRRRARARSAAIVGRRRRASVTNRAARRAAGSGRRSARAPRARARGRASLGEASSSRCGRPISAFSAAGVPSATIRPSSMIPTRSASWSASSRYCVVRKTVVPSSLSRRTSSQSVMRLTGSSPVVGSSRNSTSGSWTSAIARSRRRRMPPE